MARKSRTGRFRSRARNAWALCSILPNGKGLVDRVSEGGREEMSRTEEKL